MSLYSNPDGLIGYNELSPYLQMLLKKGSGSGGGVYIERSYLILTETKENVLVNLNTFNPSSDELLVFKNGLFMTLGLEYKFNITSKSISPINGEIWDATESKPIIFDFISIEKTSGKTNNTSSIDFIKINILKDEWIEEDGMYYKNINHNLSSDSLILSASDSDTKKSLQEIYTIIDENTLKLYNDSKINLSLTVINVNSSGSSGTESNSTIMEISHFDYMNDLQMYKVNVIHNLNSEDLLIGAIDISTKKSVHIAYDIIDNNNIIIYNTNDSPLKLSILSIK